MGRKYLQTFSTGTESRFDIVMEHLLLETLKIRSVGINDHMLISTIIEFATFVYDQTMAFLIMSSIGVFFFFFFSYGNLPQVFFHANSFQISFYWITEKLKAVKIMARWVVKKLLINDVSL